MKNNITESDLGQKLHDTVCRYQGDPVYVTVHNAKKGILNLWDLVEYNKIRGGLQGAEKIKPLEIKHDDPDFDISGIPLGYVQSDKDWRVTYVSRIPARRVKQGVCANHIRCMPPVEGTSNYTNSYGIMFTQGFKNMVLDTYPSLEEQMKGLRKACEEQREFNGEAAISRDICISINSLGVISVYFKNQLVGWIPPGKTQVYVKASDLAWVISKFLGHVLGWQIE